MVVKSEKIIQKVERETEIYKYMGIYQEQK
jgi:hypothetical protein